jgi:GntR family transcriptional regulator
MQIRVSPSDGIPIYLQVVNQVKYLIASGRLSAGERLPPVRRLAEQLLINPNTVARAYRELETMGALVTRQGSGVFVSDSGSPLAAGERKKILMERVDALLADARHMSADLEEVIGLVRQRNREMDKKGKEGRS